MLTCFVTDQNGKEYTSFPILYGCEKVCVENNRKLFVQIYFQVTAYYRKF